ncbi:CBS domain-containing protein [Desulfobacca acetoxidans]|uniref:CBS domain containing protein n=1 Tax=Desulfobacca acetoxidans (strain ATCC 700848 / DSM 11109 / ASRB2) TaxID=880072 RepID=F2NJW1_DESAR|nr:CBS domain-containing protein [Desulfobacca acetoxidans]AEB09905.1 CBS domain containing protein [Desulfobacca acetoxidans DSM 11109]
MSYEQKIKDLMVSLEDYPHVPFWFSLEQAAVIAREAAIKFEGVFEPRAILVFDEKYHLVGILTLKDIIRGLQAELFDKSGMALAGFSWRDLTGPDLQGRAQKAVSEVMSPISVTVDADTPLVTALSLMIKDNLERIPVLENNRVIGILRITDLFREISDALLAATKL